MIEFSEELVEKGMKAIKEFHEAEVDSNKIKNAIASFCHDSNWLKNADRLHGYIEAKYCSEITEMMNFIIIKNSIANIVNGERGRIKDKSEQLFDLLNIDLRCLYAKALKETGEIANITDIIVRVY